MVGLRTWSRAPHAAKETCVEVRCSATYVSGINGLVLMSTQIRSSGDERGA
jgi:hypothetical protein